MRQVVLDTETTGLDPNQGHRIIEIGCLEIVNRRVTGQTFQRYLNPERPIDAGAQIVHGITTEFLSDKPKFYEVVDEFLAFIQGAELIIHNAPFDVGFLDSELAKLPQSRGQLMDYCSVLDTLAMARELHPGQRNGLDALCKRYHVDNSHRELHGALLDAKILAEVYLFMTGGQGALFSEPLAAQSKKTKTPVTKERQVCELLVVRATPEELQSHEKYLEFLAKKSGKRFWYDACNTTAHSLNGVSDDQSGSS